MNKPSEADIIKWLDENLSALGDPKACARVLRWAGEKFDVVVPSGAGREPVVPPAHQPAPIPKKSKRTKKEGGKAKPALTLVKDLNLKPSGKKSFEGFVAEKKPGNNNEKCVAAVYYLKHEVGTAKVSTNHVFTCFKIQGWRVPSDLANALQYTASRNGWVDTSDMEDIKVTTHGENLIEHDLPEPSGKTPKK